MLIFRQWHPIGHCRRRRDYRQLRSTCSFCKRLRMCRAPRGVALWAEMPWVAPPVGILPPRRGSNVNIVFTVGFATPKALASPTSKFRRRYAAVVAPLRAPWSGGGLTASYAHNVRLQAVTIVLRFARMTRRRDAAATPSRPSGECRPQGGYNDGVSSLTTCETAVRRRTLQRRNCNDGVPAVDGM